MRSIGEDSRAAGGPSGAGGYRTRVDQAGSESRGRGFYRGLALFWTNLCLCLLVINGIAAAVERVWKPESRVAEPAYVDEALATIYPDWPEADRQALREETRRGFEPDALVQFRERASRGRFVNVDPNGFRVGREQGPWPPEDRYFNVYVLGGSTAFGYGVADDETIPSHLQALLAEVGLPRPPRVYNFARGAFYSTMERILLDKLITLGPAPDLVVFIDGLNEFYWQDDPPKLTSAWTAQGQSMLEHPLRAGLESVPVMRLVRAWRHRHEVETFGTGSQDELPRRVAVHRADRIIDRYVRNKAVIEALAAAEGTRVVMVWQPVPTYGYDLHYHVYDGSFGRHELTRVGYPRMRQYTARHPLGEDFIWCAEIQRDARELLYVDQVHYSPALSRQVAACIVDGLVERRLLPVTGGRP